MEIPAEMLAVLREQYPADYVLLLHELIQTFGPELELQVRNGGSGRPFQVERAAHQPGSKAWLSRELECLRYAMERCCEQERSWYRTKAAELCGALVTVWINEKELHDGCGRKGDFAHARDRLFDLLGAFRILSGLPQRS